MQPQEVRRLEGLAGKTLQARRGPRRESPCDALRARRKGISSRRPKRKSPAKKQELGARLWAAWRKHQGWLLRAVLFYLTVNILLNLGLALTRPLQLRSLLELGHLDARSQAAYLLMRHQLWHETAAEEERIPELVREVAQEEGVDGDLLRALVETESNLRPHVISPVGACGLGQLMPATAQALGIGDPFHPVENLRGTARYLKGLRRQFGDLSLALAAYNAGPGAVRRAGGVPPFKETRHYVSRIRARYAELSPARPRPAVKSPTPAPKSPSSAGKGPTPASKTPSNASKSPTPAPKSPSSASKSPTPAPKSPSSASKSPTPAPKSPSSASKGPTPAPRSPSSASKSPTPAP